MATPSKKISEEVYNYINSKIQKKRDLHKRHDYTMWAFINIRLLKEKGVFEI